MLKLIYGNCLEEMDKLISSNIKVDVIITDPPYGTTACKWDSIIPLDEMWIRLDKLIKRNGAIVLFGNEPFSSMLRMSNVKEYKYDWVWNKKLGGNPLNAKIMPLKTIENIMVFGKGRVNYYPIMRTGIMRTKGGSKKQPEHTGKFNTHYKIVNDQYYPTAIIEISNANNRKNRYHPTQKPEMLMEYLVRTYSKQNDIVLDFAMGSGTTGVVCRNLNRSFIGIEILIKYFNTSEDRIYGR